jgi:hypothetical protein
MDLHHKPQPYDFRFDAHTGPQNKRSRLRVAASGGEKQATNLLWRRVVAAGGNTG